MSRDRYETWVCPYCNEQNREVRYAANAPGYYKAGQWQPDDMPQVRCSRCEFNTTWLDVDSNFAISKLYQRDPDAHPFGTPIGN